MKLGRCDTCDTLRDALQVERQRVERLTGEMLTMKREGFTPPVQYAQPEQPTGLPLEVVSAIDQISNGRGPMKAVMRASADLLLSRGESAEAIAAHLWGTYSAGNL